MRSQLATRPVWTANSGDLAIEVWSGWQISLTIPSRGEAMDADAVKQTIASRLKAELARKGLTATTLASDSGIDQSSVDAYLRARREISFAELGPLCETLGMRLMNLLSPSFHAPRLQYRLAPPKDRRRASGIENAFVLLADFLPTPKRVPAVNSVNEDETDIAYLLTTIRFSVEALRARFPTVEALYEAAGLPLLPVSAGSDGFDAFLLSIGKQAVVCVNRDKPPARIHFSILHEMAHYLFHRDRDIPLDILGEDYYADNIRPEVIPEYVANKFAQQYLIPFDLAEEIAAHRKLPADIHCLIAKQRTTPEVLANAVFDCARLRPHTPRYSEIIQEIKRVAGTGWGSDRSVVEFVEAAGSSVRQAATKAQKEFSPQVWRDIDAAWELGNA